MTTMTKKYKVKTSARYRREFKKIMKRGYDKNKIKTVIDILSSGEPLPEQYSDHDLHGNFKGFRECHIDYDWLLVYRIFKNELILFLMSTGTHSDIF